MFVLGSFWGCSGLVLGSLWVCSWLQWFRFVVGFCFVFVIRNDDDDDDDDCDG